MASYLHSVLPPAPIAECVPAATKHDPACAQSLKPFPQGIQEVSTTDFEAAGAAVLAIAGEHQQQAADSYHI